jgi:hypothetical protein
MPSSEYSSTVYPRAPRVPCSRRTRRDEPTIVPMEPPIAPSEASGPTLAPKPRLSVDTIKMHTETAVSCTRKSFSSVTSDGVTRGNGATLRLHSSFPTPTQAPPPTIIPMYHVGPAGIQPPGVAPCLILSW